MRKNTVENKDVKDSPASEIVQDILVNGEQWVQGIEPAKGQQRVSSRSDSSLNMILTNSWTREHILPPASSYPVSHSHTPRNTP